MPSGHIRKRRSKLEVSLDILGVIASGETKPTRIMSATNMSWRQLHIEFDKLRERGFITIRDASDDTYPRDDKRTKYKYLLTPKGENVLRYMRKTAVEVESLMAEIHISRSF